MEIENPFIWKTKGDVVRSIVDHGGGPLIKHTVSCTRTYDITRLHTHCGCCSQCLDRRFAVFAANAAEHDPVEMYKVELLVGAGAYLAVGARRRLPMPTQLSAISTAGDRHHLGSQSTRADVADQAGNDG
jgi:hypothetical protein